MKFIEKIERVIVLSLLVMMVLVVLLSTIDLGWLIIKDIITPPVLLLDINELLDIFGVFLLVLIGVELLETVKMYLTEKVVHVEVVFTVAMIAIARKVIILDIKEVLSLTLIGIAAIIVALSFGYYLLTKNIRLVQPQRLERHTRVIVGAHVTGSDRIRFERVPSWRNWVHPALFREVNRIICFPPRAQYGHDRLSCPHPSEVVGNLWTLSYDWIYIPVGSVQ